MPKINIRETDNTTPGSRAYSNFTVVVPGFHAPFFAEVDNQTYRRNAKGIISQKLKAGSTDVNDQASYEVNTDRDVFGNAGIREFSSVSEFEKTVGIVPPKALKQDVKLTTDVEVTRDELGQYSISFLPVFGKDGEDNVSEFLTQAFKPTLEPIPGVNTTATIEDVIEDENTTEEPVEPTEPTPEIPEPLQLVLTQFEYDGRIYECERADASDTLAGKYKATVTIEVDIPAHYGNQIAYELLSLGYTIYYVNMGEFYPDKPKTIINEGQITEQVSEYYDNTAIYEAIKALGDLEFWADLKDKTTYDFRFILTGLIEGGSEDSRAVYDVMNQASQAISTLADYEVEEDIPLFERTRRRGDCIALIDLDEAAIARRAQAGLREGSTISTKTLVNAIKSEIRTLPASINKYSAIFCSSVNYSNNSRSGIDTYASDTGSEGYNNSRFPATFHYLACFDQMLLNNFREWFAVAGFTRGVSAYTIDSTRFDLGDIAVQALEPRYLDDKDENQITRAVNVIVRNQNSYYLWGNRTGHKLEKELVASHFLNVRQLCTSIKKYVYTLCRNFTFDPNSDILWANFTLALKPLLETMKVGQGIKDYRIQKVATSLKGTLAARIRIIPIEAVEDFDIELVLEDSFDGPSATVTD